MKTDYEKLPVEVEGAIAWLCVAPRFGERLLTTVKEEASRCLAGGWEVTALCSADTLAKQGQEIERLRELVSEWQAKHRQYHESGCRAGQEGCNCILGRTKAALEGHPHDK